MTIPTDPTASEMAAQSRVNTNHAAHDQNLISNQMLRDLPGYAGVDVLREDWGEHKDELKGQSPALFVQLNKAVVARANELEAA